VNRQFQAKMPKYENCFISKIVNPIKPKFEENMPPKNPLKVGMHANSSKNAKI